MQLGGDRVSTSKAATVRFDDSKLGLNHDATAVAAGRWRGAAAAGSAVLLQRVWGECKGNI
jgi:hypothetical protein